jgi:putative ABC transport system permease protein
MGNDINVVMIAAADDVDIKVLEVKVKDLLKAKHHIAPEDAAAVQSFNLQEIFLMFRYLFLGINILVWIVGMGTLLAGVVGVSNIMLVSIRERTQEIGIKRALGAKPKVILLQIMSESVVLTFIAGFIGLFMGVLLLVALDKVIGTKEMFTDPFISFSLAVIASLIILISGAVAGIIPARSALKVKAIDALRDE